MAHKIHTILLPLFSLYFDEKYILSSRRKNASNAANYIKSNQLAQIFRPSIRMVLQITRNLEIRSHPMITRSIITSYLILRCSEEYMIQMLNSPPLPYTLHPPITLADYIRLWHSWAMCKSSIYAWVIKNGQQTSHVVHKLVSPMTPV